MKLLDIEKLIASIMVTVDRITINSIQTGNAKKRKKAHKIKSIEERLKAKEGRFRQHLMGKRVDFSARSVISPDSNLALDELGVPEKIARSLTIPEEVTEWNYERIIELCKKGSVKFILRPSIDNKKYEDFIYVNKLANSAEQIEKHLSYGTIVERNL
jgi:DNA-directed RNA polymerase beta' subunit